jgi:hypothetical protein
MVMDFSANASFLGYFYQSRYALLILLSAETDDPAISLEKYDDITFQDKGSVLASIQTKHHLNSIKSLSDASSDFWKTIRVWCSTVKNREIIIEDLTFTLVTTQNAPDNSAASFLRPTNRSETRALEILMDIAKNSTNKDNKPAYQAFRDLSPAERQQLMEKIIILDASPNIIDVEDKIKRKLRVSCRAEHVDLIFPRLEGWWMGKIILHLKNTDDTSAILHQSSLLAFLHDICEEYHADNLPIEFFNDDIFKEDDLPESKKMFIRQLEIVGVNNPRIQQAIGDYYRAFHQRSKWVREDLLLTDELKKYERRLTDEWSRLFEEMKEEISVDTTSQEKGQKGRELFSQIVNQCVTRSEFHIRPRCTEPYVVRGSYHMLADDLRIGWHVDFINKLVVLEDRLRSQKLQST